MHAVPEVAEAAGLPMSKVTAWHALALATAQLQAARGLPPMRQGQTRQPDTPGSKTAPSTAAADTDARTDHSVGPRS
jgi:hypothetical protein